MDDKENERGFSYIPGEDALRWRAMRLEIDKLALEIEVMKRQRRRARHISLFLTADLIALGFTGAAVLGVSLWWGPLLIAPLGFAVFYIAAVIEVHTGR